LVGQTGAMRTPRDPIYAGHRCPVFGLAELAPLSPRGRVLTCPHPMRKGSVDVEFPQWGGFQPFAATAANGEVAPIPDLPGLAREWRGSVESECGAVAVGRTYLFPPLSSGGDVAEKANKDASRSSKSPTPISELAAGFVHLKACSTHAAEQVDAL
jgi:hypothetical protein